MDAVGRTVRHDVGANEMMLSETGEMVSACQYSVKNEWRCSRRTAAETAYDISELSFGTPIALVKFGMTSVDQEQGKARSPESPIMAHGIVG